MLAQLEAAYDRREQLWAQLEQDLTQCGIVFFSLFHDAALTTWAATQAKAVVECLPAEIEETITRLEKKSKDMEKKEKKAVSNQKMLRDLVEKM